jgi:plasmid stabilization system protein ParE
LWKGRAERQLAETWSNAADRRAVTAAANSIDRMLQTDPQTHGESRSGGRRVLVVPPLAIAFEIHEQVLVLSVRYRSSDRSK